MLQIVPKYRDKIIPEWCCIYNMSEKSVNFIFSYSLRALISNLLKFIGLDGFATSNYYYIFYSVKAFGKKSDAL